MIGAIETNDVLDAVLTPESVRMIESLSPLAKRVAQRWVLGWPREAQLLEACGQLPAELKRQTQREESALADARVGGENSHLADHELLELWDVAPRPPR